MKKLILASVAALALSASGAMADGLVTAKKGTIKLDVRLTNVAPDEKGDVLTAAGADTTLNVAIGNYTIPTIGIEYYLTDNVSVEAIAGVTRHKISVPGIKAALNATPSDDLAKVWILPPNITAKYHFNTNSAFVPYVGAGINYMLYYSIKEQSSLPVSLKNKGGLALQAGFDVNTTSKLSYNFDVKYDFVKTDAKVAGGAYKSNVTVNPLIVSLGVGYKF